MGDAFESDFTHESLIHDLNNVFETITEAAELLEADERWKPLAAALCRSAARGRRLLGSIPDTTPNLAAVVEDAIQSINDYCMAARKPTIKFISYIPADLRLPGSAKDWERVFANLFLNAVQVVDKSGRIEIAAHRADASLSITVSDNGPGIPVDILSRIFRPDVSTKMKSARRSGLGLHIVESTVKKYSGRVIAANRDQGSGAVFTILVPVS